MSVAPNSPRARPSASAVPAASPGMATGIITRTNAARLRRAERAGRVEQRAVHRGERGHRLADVERRRHEGQRHHHARGGRARARCPAASTAPPRMPDGPDRREQGDARHGGREHERQLDEGHHHRLAAERARGEQVGRRRADDQDDRERDRGGAQAQPEGLERPRLAEASTSSAGLQSTKIATIGQRQEGERRRQGERPAAPGTSAGRTHGAGPKPASSSASAQGPSTSRSTNVWACSGCLAPSTTPAP